MKEREKEMEIVQTAARTSKKKDARLCKSLREKERKNVFLLLLLFFSSPR